MTEDKYFTATDPLIFLAFTKKLIEMCKRTNNIDLSEFKEFTFKFSVKENSDGSVNIANMCLIEGDIRGDKDMSEKWIQKASSKMEKKGTKGSFTKLAKKAGGVKKEGGIKESFIAKELHSKNQKIRKKAQFAKNMKKIAK